jgi:hypothetical protein
MYCAIFAESKNCGDTTAGRYLAAARKQQKELFFSAQSVPMVAPTTVEYVMPSLSKNRTATEEQCFLRDMCRGYIMSSVLKSGQLIR